MPSVLTPPLWYRPVRRMQKGRKKSDGKAVLNVDLWKKYVDVSSNHSIKYEWIKGHNGHEYNERCDSIAVSEAEKFM